MTLLVKKVMDISDMGIMAVVDVVPVDISIPSIDILGCGVRLVRQGSDSEGLGLLFWALKG